MRKEDYEKEFYEQTLKKELPAYVFKSCSVGKIVDNVIEYILEFIEEHFVENE